MKRFAELFLMLLLLFSSAGLTQAKNVEKKYDAIIVPGFPFEPDGKMNAVYRMRLAWAYELYQQGRTGHIILSGGAVHTPYVESEIFALYLMKMGIPAEALILERQAEHSLENVFYSMEIAEKYGFEHVAVATDWWQSGMIQFLGKLEGHDLSKVDFVPAKFSIVNRYWKSFEFEIDHQMAYESEFVPLVSRETKQQRKLGTHGLLWKPSENVEICFATELNKQ
ncbi:MAG: YdcF family protein [Flavobacteriales bacterium]|nr:YdcF family protein [Flavobacteriales bacterium]